MNIAFYMPFKPMGHPNPSGDLVTGTELYDFFRGRGHRIDLVSRLRCRWLFLKPWRWPGLVLERLRVLRRLREKKPDIWLSYHSYYKAPDMLGPWCARRLDIPYVLFQGVYSTKRRRSLKTLPGFLLNRRVLRAARIVFTNKRRDEQNLRRLLPSDRVVYVGPGIHPHDFRFDAGARRKLRDRWRVNSCPVVLTAAMFRDDVKTEGILSVIDACAAIIERANRLHLVIVGDGAGRKQVEQAVQRQLPPGVCILEGRVDRREMHRYYSAADLFVFPGVNESLGMVYLEAQSCGLPVVAYGDWGAAEAVDHGRSGLLASADDPAGFGRAIEQLLNDPDLRRRMGAEGSARVRRSHDLVRNYTLLEQKLTALAGP